MNIRDKIVLGALFHDIGKVVQRASDNPRKMTHQEFGAEWLRNFYKNTPLEELADFALYHHTGTKRPELDVSSKYPNDLHLVAHADNLSAGERKIPEKVMYDMMRPLKSIFSSVKINSEPQPAFFSLSPLSKGIFYPDSELKNLTTEDYKRILSEFKDTLSSRTNDPDAILSIMEEYFSLVPSHTATAEGVTDDVSLFDHLKTTAAIALAAYNFLAEKHGIDGKEMPFSQLPTQEITDTKTKRYMFIGVDISGIQNFIYTISSKGALKLLRARSFYVEMLLEFLAMRILKKLKLYRTNLLFLGGGNFIILAQNTENARKLVDHIIYDFNDRLFDEHQGRLWLVHDYVKFEGEVFTTKKGDKGGKRTIADVLEELHEKLRRAKVHKFASFEKLKDKLFQPQEIEGRRECKVCGRESNVRIAKIGYEEIEICETCHELYRAGRIIHKAKYVVYKPTHEPEHKLGELTIYRGEKLILSKEPLDGEFAWIVNPSWDEPIEYGTALYLGNYPQKGRNFDPDMEDNEAPSFNYFGAELVGTLRMDVDNLGYIFSRGLLPEQRSISRLATLSRFFNLFFRRFINDIAVGKLGEGVEQFSIVHPGETAPREAVVVYAGGDDLFIVGAWHDVIELAFDIRETFRRFIGGDHITISGGFALNHVKHPIHLFARNAGEAEDKAKDSDGKDALTAFGRTMKWKKWYRVIKEQENKGLLYIRKNFYDSVNTELDQHQNTKIEPAFLSSLKGEKLLPRAFIYRLMQISDKLSKEGLKLRPFLVLIYFFGKNNELKKHFGEWLKIDRNSLEFLQNLRPALAWLDLLSRGRKEENYEKQ